MGMHDTMAQKALAAGKTSRDFSTAAQRHANATWVWIIAVGATWYFADWKWALIPAALLLLSAIKSISSTLISGKLEELTAPNKEINHQLESIIQEYGQILEDASTSSDTIPYDEEKLPYPKDKIKLAILGAIESGIDDQSVESLKAALLTLADWQDKKLSNSQQLEAMQAELDKLAVLIDG